MDAIHTESGKNIDPGQEGNVDPSLNLGQILGEMKQAIELSKALARRAREAESNEEAFTVFAELISKYESQGGEACFLLFTII